jgi:phospho-N-acetylmuramoyl-pentapeptide-transferase
VIGFIDDYAKVMNKRNLGLDGAAEVRLQMLVAAALITGVLAIMQYYGAYTTTLNVPFLKQFQPDLLIHALMGNPFTYALAFLPFYCFSCLWWWDRAMP